MDFPFLSVTRVKEYVSESSIFLPIFEDCETNWEAICVLARV